MELWLTNVRWVDPNGRFESGALRCVEGRLRLLPGHEGPAPAEAQVVDGAGMLAMPGLIDPHVHLREPGQRYKEGIANGTRAALAGGVTTVLDMPNNRPPVTTPARVEAKRRRFSRWSLVSFGLFQQGVPRGFAAAPGIAGVKVYLAKSSALGGMREVDRLAALFAAADRVAVHAEDEGCFVEGTALPHHEARPVEAIESGLARVEAALRRLAPGLRPRVVLCHATGRAEVEWLRRMKAEGFDVWGETAPHYLLLTQEDFLREGARLQVNPPLRGDGDRRALWEALADGTIDFLGTDHAPHVPAEKQGPRPPSGMPGVEWLGPFLVTLGLDGRLPWKRVQELGCGAEAACYGIAGRDGLRDGNAADLALYRLSGSPASRLQDVVTRAGYCPYPAFEFGAEVFATVVGGRLKYQDGSYPDRTPGSEVYP